MDIVVQRISVIFGYLAVVLVLLVFASSKPFHSLSNWIGAKTMASSERYQSFARKRTTFWQFFLFVLVVHVALAVAHTGIPQSSDPDSPTHWTILILGLVATVVTGGAFRLSGNWVENASKQDGPGAKYFKFFIKSAVFFWLLAFAIIAAHFIIAILHIGVWPQPEM